MLRGGDGEYLKKAKFSESFLMTIGGNVLENNANVVELTSLNRVGVGVPPCLQNLAPFPENVQFAAGGLLSRSWTKFQLWIQNIVDMFCKQTACRPFAVAATGPPPSRPVGATAWPRTRGARSARCRSPRAGWATTSRGSGASSWPAARQYKTSPITRQVLDIFLKRSDPEINIKSQLSTYLSL